MIYLYRPALTVCAPVPILGLARSRCDPNLTHGIGATSGERKMFMLWIFTRTTWYYHTLLEFFLKKNQLEEKVPVEKWWISHSIWSRRAGFSLTPCMTNESMNEISFTHACCRTPVTLPRSGELSHTHFSRSSDQSSTCSARLQRAIAAHLQIAARRR